jgi:uncharacterized protein
MELKKHVFGWIEIPVADMDRAIKFYEAVFQFKISRNQMGPLDMGWFPYPTTSPDTPAPGAGGSLVYHADFYKPSADGALVYFTSQTENLGDELGRVEAAGGKILVPKTLIAPDYGYMGVFMDSEGNRVAVHSKN